MAVRASAPRLSPGPKLPTLGQRADVGLAIALGGLLALLLILLPLQAALAAAAVGAFAILAFVDTRAAIFALLFARSLVDVGAGVPVIGAAGPNAAALMGLLVIALGISHIATNRINLLGVPLAGPFLLFLSVTAVGIAIAPDSTTALEDWLRTASAFMLYVLIVDLMQNRSDIRWLLRIMIAAAVIPVTVGLVQIFTGRGDEATQGVTRAFGTFTHPSPFAFFLLGLLPLAIAYAVNAQSRLTRLALFALVPAMVLCIYGTQTRGAWIGLVVIATVHLATRARWKALLVPAAAVVLFFVIPGVEERFSEARTETGSVAWRQQQWGDALALPSPAQIVTVGAGLGAVDTRLGELAHNEYVRLLVETGLIGLLAVIVIYKRLLFLALKTLRSTTDRFTRDITLAFTMVLAARVVVGFADNIIIFPVLEWYFWGFAAAVVALSGAYRSAARTAQRRVPLSGAYRSDAADQRSGGEEGTA